MADVDANTGAPVQIDAFSEPAPATPAPAEQTAPEQADAPIIEVDGKPVTEKQIRDAISALENKTQWEGKLKTESSELKQLKDLLEMQRQSMFVAPQAQQIPSRQQIDNTPTVLLESLKAAILSDDVNAFNQAIAMINEGVQNSANQTYHEAQTKERIRSSFLNEHPDYEKTIQSSEFREFASQKPEYNTVNAYLEFDRNRLIRQIDEVKKQSFQQGEQTTIKNLQAKGQIKVLNGTGAAPVAPASAAPLSHQELLETITKGIEERRQAG